MESHPLNLAHQQHRRADTHFMNNRFDEAMQCHHNAAELLLDAMKSTSSSVAIESISLQHSYHLNQKDLIKSKKEQYARVKKAMENLKQGKETIIKQQSNDCSKIQIAIYKTINQTDSLLQILTNEKESENEQGLSTNATIKIDGRKMEKTQKTIIEELGILRQNLHSLIEKLVFEVEILKDENMTLKEKVNYLEKERNKYLNIPISYGIETDFSSPPTAQTNSEIVTDTSTARVWSS